jgi:hypothetical protein
MNKRTLNLTNIIVNITKNFCKYNWPLWEQHGAEKKHDVSYTNGDKGHKLVCCRFFETRDKNRNFYRVEKVEKLLQVRKTLDRI